MKILKTKKGALSQEKIIVIILTILILAAILWWLFGVRIQNWIYNLPSYDMPQEDVEIDLTKVKDVAITTEVLSKCVVLVGDIENNYLRINLDQIYSNSVQDVKSNLKFRPLKTELSLEKEKILDYRRTKLAPGTIPINYNLDYGNVISNKIVIDKNYLNKDYYTKNILFSPEYSSLGNIPSIEQLQFIDGTEVKEIKKPDGEKGIYLCKTEEEFKKYREEHKKIIENIKKSGATQQVLNFEFTNGINDRVLPGWNFDNNKAFVTVQLNYASIFPGPNILLTPENFDNNLNILKQYMDNGDINSLTILIHSKTPLSLSKSIVATIGSGRVSFDKKSVSEFQINNIMYGIDFAEELQ